MSTVASVLDAIQTLNATVSGVRWAPLVAAYPNAIPAERLPAAITVAGPSVWHQGGMGGRQKNSRTFVTRVFVAPEDAKFAEAYASALTLLESFGAFWRAQVTVDGQPIIRQGVDLTDAGLLKTIGYGGTQYHGFDLSIPVWVGA